MKNDLILKALRGEKVSRPAVWIMRQAGRYLPDFMKLKQKYDFFTRCRNPELATEITLMPVRQLGVDAAILFSDILVVPQAMGIDFQIKENIGPFLEHPIRSIEDVQKIEIPDVADRLNYVFEAVRLTKQALEDTVPLIGFAGAPWTILCYSVEGKGSKSFDQAKGFCFSQPDQADTLLQKITDTTIKYLLKKVKYGADAIQIFDSWGGVLSPEDYDRFSWRYTHQIVERLSPKVPVIVFSKGCWHALNEMKSSGVSALGIDWTISPKTARRLTESTLTLQGNYDPARLLAPKSEIKKGVQKMVKDFGTHRYIANLGHGILPQTPVDHARTFIETIKEL